LWPAGPCCLYAGRLRKRLFVVYAERLAQNYRAGLLARPIKKSSDTS